MRKKFCVLAAVLLAALQGCGGGQEDTGADNVEEVVENLFEDLEEAEYELIRYPQRGVCLYKCGNDRHLLAVHAPPHKERLFGSAGGR